MGSVMRFGKSNTDHFFFLHTAFRSQQGNLMLPDNAFKAGVKYTLAFWVKGSKAMQMLVGIMEPAGEKPVAPYKTFNITTSWQRIVYTFTATDKSQSDTRLYIRGEHSVTFNWLMFTKFVLVEGNKAPEWTDSSREFKAQMEANEQVLTAMRNNYTQIDGGLILSTFLKLGALLKSGVYQESAGVKAKLSSINEVAAYFGGTLAEAIAGTKEGMAIIYHNGKIKADNVEIKGKVVATSGEFSGKVYATDGEFKGKINIGNGAIVLNKDGSGSIGNAGTSWQDDGVLHVNDLVVQRIWGFNQITQNANYSVDIWSTTALAELWIPDNDTTKLPAQPLTAFPLTVVNRTNYRYKRLNGNGHKIIDKGSESDEIFISNVVTLMYNGKWIVISRYDR